jgi:hypothetical protein
MSLSGCDRELVPSTTVLKTLVQHISPIMEDSGFHTKLEHIRCTLITAMRGHIAAPNVEFDLRPISDDSGSPKEWAGAVKQLMLFASRGETAYLKTNIRGGWLTAFAVHVLSMECTVLHQS